MSRIIVKDLPKKISEERIREIFEKKGIVTDIQLKFTEEGKFRRFCFIGYKNDKDAQAAVEYFNKSCIDTARISVSLSTELGDPSKPKSWSKHSADSNMNKNLEVTEKSVDKIKKYDNKKDKKTEIDPIVKESLKKYKDDPLFQEFMETKTQRGDLKNKWSNEILSSSSENCSENENVQENDEVEEFMETNKSNIAKSTISDHEYVQMLKKQTNDNEENNIIKKQSVHGSKIFFTVKVTGLAYNHKKKHVKQFFKPLKPKSIRVPRNIKGIAYVGFKLERHMNQALNKNKSFLDGKQIFVSKYNNPNNQMSDIEAPNKVKWKKQEEALKDEESIAESGSIFFRNLTYSTTENDMRILFEKYGPLTEISMPIDKDTRKTKGFGTVTFLMPEHAVKAHNALDGTSFQGRLLHLLPAKLPTPKDDFLQDKNLSHKEKKVLLQKATAGSSHNWNTLFLGQNAVVDAISSSYKIKKEDVLNDTAKGTSAAVRLALGETQLVEKTRQFLENNGVQLNVFNQPSEKRSSTVIIAKNLPKETTLDDIKNLFSKFGELSKVILPPHGITALIEFAEPFEARKAFKKLAYTRFKYLPLYLEWAPENTFTNSVNNSEPVLGQIQIKNIVTDKENQREIADDDDDEPEPDTTLFVKNLNFSTSEEELKKHFEKCGPIHYVNIVTKKDMKNSGQLLSMGYGFVRYKLKLDTDKALKQLQLTTLNGKTLELKRSERTLQSDVKTVRKTTNITFQTGTRILVRNIPFQATSKEVEEIFKTYGQLKGVRIPKKLVGAEKHKGFGFVEYLSKKDAKMAFKALCQSTHLYGRRLCLEWAHAEEDIEEIRKRTAKHYHKEPAIKKLKKSMLSSDSLDIMEKI